MHRNQMDQLHAFLFQGHPEYIKKLMLLTALPSPHPQRNNMNKEELINSLNAIANRQKEGFGNNKFYGSCEDEHMEADNLLLNYINDSEVSKAFESIERW